MIYLDHLLKATQCMLRSFGKYSHFDAFSHDTRQLLPGELFVAVRGEHGDGHDYLLDATQRGATGILAEARVVTALSQEMQSALEQTGVTLMLVEDTRTALQQYARAILERWHPIVIAVTGSTGKTSTKEAIASVLASNFATFSSWQNYNDLLGLPLSLGRLEERHELAVLELGCDHPGEISDLCRIIHPQIGVLTNISPTQLQYFGTLERLATELTTLLTTLPEEGTAIVNAEDGNSHLEPTFITALRERKIHLVSPSPLHHVQVTWEGVRAQVRTSSRVNSPPGERKLASHFLGAHYAFTMRAAFMVGELCGLDSEQIQHALSNLYPLVGRLNPLPGICGSTLLDDTHNATPASVLAGLETLKALPAGRRIAILGDMLRLGDYEEEAHRLIGRAAASRVDYLITRGERAALIAQAARSTGLPATQVIATATHTDAAQAAREILERPSTPTAPAASHAQGQGPVVDVLLIKGSEEARMERVTELLLARPEQAAEQLVRQTPGWKQIVVMRAERPTWVEIDLGAIGHNTRQIKALVGPHVRILASLKADAYGHGALKVARTVLQNGASMVGVATVSEATPLREAGIRAPILVFGYVPPWQMREAVRLGLTVTLYSAEAATALSRAALALAQSVNVHIKVDTGMGRLGIRAEQVEEVVALVRKVQALPGLELEGLFTHFAMADSVDDEQTHVQMTRFRHVLQVLETEHLRPLLVHAANSAATLTMPEAHFDMVRPGIALYGLDPSSQVRLPEGFRAALSFKTLIAQIKVIPANECIGYGCAFRTERPTRIAVLPVGYADGFRRAPSNWGSALIHGQEAALVGRVCMDQCMVDVSHIPQAREGDEVVLIGRQGAAALSAEQVAQRLGTSNYEVVSAILARVPRVD